MDLDPIHPSLTLLISYPSHTFFCQWSSKRIPTILNLRSRSTDMPRKRPQLEDPDDSNEVMKFIKALAKHSNYKNLQKLVNDDPAVCRTPTLQRRNANEELDVNSQSRKAAVATHVYGQVSQQACQKCKNHEGPFAECVVLADYNDLSLGCCSNCRWKGYTRTSGKRYFCDAARRENSRHLA